MTCRTFRSPIRQDCGVGPRWQPQAEMRLRTGSAWRDSEDGLKNGILKAISRVTEGLVGKLKEASDHIANRLYRENFSHPLTQGVHQKDDADIYGGDQIKKAGSDHAATSGVKPNPSEKSADEYLRSVYEDRYHMDGSAQAYEYARSLASLPDQLHRIVAAHVKEKPHGGIWLGGGNLHDLGHAEWSATKRRDQKPGGVARWKDLGRCQRRVQRGVSGATRRPHATHQKRYRGARIRSRTRCRSEQTEPYWQNQPRVGIFSVSRQSSQPHSKDETGHF